MPNLLHGWGLNEDYGKAEAYVKEKLFKYRKDVVLIKIIPEIFSNSYSDWKVYLQNYTNDTDLCLLTRSFILFHRLNLLSTLDMHELLICRLNREDR